MNKTDSDRKIVLTKEEKKKIKEEKKVKKKQAKSKKRKETNNKKKKSKILDNMFFKILLLPFIFIGKVFYKLRKKIRLSISFKISATYLGLYLISMVIVICVAIFGYMTYKVIDLEQTGNRYTRLIIEKTIDRNEVLEDYLIDERLEGIAVYDSSYKQIVNTNNYQNGYIENSIYRIDRMITSKVYIYHYTGFSYEGQGLYYLNIYFDISTILDETLIIAFFIVCAGLLGMIIMAAIGPSASRQLVKPINDMTEVTRTISVNNINTRLDVKASQYELKELAETFNHMMDRIESDYVKQQQFVSDASHELRTPIAVIKGYADMLDRWGKDDKEVLQESLEAIKNETNNMQDLVEKLLFIARNDKKTLKLNKEEFNINEVIEEVFRETKMIDTCHKISSSACKGAIVYADKNRIKQAIRIFVENARKFTPENGKIDISCIQNDEYAVITIKDEGVGIKNKDLKKVFDRFYRAEESRGKDSGGHGLGLSIAKIIVLGHRGKIKVKSNYNNGSSFSILLPYIKSVD
jgi:signal transduction histidine kinase